MGPCAPSHLPRSGLRFQLPMATDIKLRDLRFGRRSRARGRIQMKAKMSKTLGFDPLLERSVIFRFTDG